RRSSRRRQRSRSQLRSPGLSCGGLSSACRRLCRRHCPAAEPAFDHLERLTFAFHRQAWFRCDCCATLFSSEVLPVIRTRDSKSASQRELGEVVVVQAGDVLVISARKSLLGLDYFDSIGDARRETIFRPANIFVSECDVLFGYIDLFLGGLKIEKSCSHVIVNLAANVFFFGLPLPQCGFGLRLM